MEEKLAAYRRMKSLEKGNSPQKMEGSEVGNLDEEETRSCMTRKKTSEPADGTSWNMVDFFLKIRVVNLTLSLLSTGSWQLAIKLCLWICLFTFFVSLGFGSVFIIVSGLYLVYTSMKSGSRVQDEPSAYSVFNEGFERLDGTFTTEQFERELKGGFAPRT